MGLRFLVGEESSEEVGVDASGLLSGYCREESLEEVVDDASIGCNAHSAIPLSLGARGQYGSNPLHAPELHLALIHIPIFSSFSLVKGESA